MFEVLQKSGKPMSTAEIKEADPLLNKFPDFKISLVAGNLVGKGKVERVAILGSWGYKIK